MMIIDQEKLVDNIIVNDIIRVYPELKKLIETCSPYEVRGKILSVLDPRNDLHYDYKEFHELNLDSEDLKYLDEIAVTLRNYVRVADTEVEEYGEVMTPIEKVNEMLDTLPSDVWNNPNLKWLDPCNGVGTFPSVVVQRLMKGLKKVIPNKNKRYRHIVENMLYVCELQAKNMFIFHCIFDRPNIFELNTFYGSFLTKDFDEHMKNVWGVEKFDIIIGNPPYQESDGGARSSAKPLYNIFINKCKDITNKLLFIVPARWYAGGKGLDNFRYEMLSENKIVKLIDFPKSTDCFPTIQLSGGVCYFLWDKDYNGDCEITTKNNETSTTTIRPLLENGFDTLIRYNDAISIIKKVESKKEKKFNDLVNSRKPFGFSTDFNNFDVNGVQIYGSKIVSYVDSEKIKQNKDWVSKHKVFISTSYGGGENYPHQIINKPFIVGPNTCCTETYLVVGPFENEKISNNVVSYMKTKFFRFMVLMNKPTQHATSKVYKFVPQQDFSKSWSDKELYEKYNLTETEINFINSLIKNID
jgi:site-specific DNA-methyltransferase (adenine-specific)